eukprot:comp12148_c0_seq1/m.6898 comp12148_c0_seq1/g.6898  ORF comp12148_c0_seq1/g.6898 comp12148_c0_seq1/m.6898 type:complete len:398 (-) comp12148_c0_seq1:121-1314(-)
MAPGTAFNNDPETSDISDEDLSQNSATSIKGSAKPLLRSDQSHVESSIKHSNVAKYGGTTCKGSGSISLPDSAVDVEYSKGSKHSCQRHHGENADCVHNYTSKGLRRALGLQHWELVGYDMLPEWLQDNNSIRKFYRPPLNSYRACFHSLLYLHNETGNIYSHLIGCLVLAAVAVYMYATVLSEHNWADNLAMTCFFVGGVVMLSMSALFHLVFCHSLQAYAVFSRCDYTGIAVMIAGSFAPATYFLFACDPTLLHVYLSLLAVLTIATLAVVYLPGFDRPRFRLLRSSVFVSMGTICVVPLFHHMVKYGYSHTDRVVAMTIQWGQLALYFSGAVIYTVRFPERLWPGKFDLWFHSHQLMHLMILGAAAVHFYGMMTGLEYRQQHQCTYEQINGFMP